MLKSKEHIPISAEKINIDKQLFELIPISNMPNPLLQQFNYVGVLNK